ncbi:hypothetical protein Scep_016524 [Stephania cephalantha]|uniref:Uncharacterized protein n=1 Tax=Stephania cephalantha TaxID=152367 RepID=A0AAP0IMV1_9MAGN
MRETETEKEIKISQVADRAKRRLATTSEPMEDCYNIFLYVLYSFVIHFLCT